MINFHPRYCMYSADFSDFCCYYSQVTTHNICSCYTPTRDNLKMTRGTCGSDAICSRGSIQAIRPSQSPRPFSKWQTRLINNRWQEWKEGAVWVMVRVRCYGAKLVMQPYWMSAEMSSLATVMMKYQNLLKYLWRMPPPLVRPTMLYLSEQENKQLTSRAWHNALPQKMEK